MFTISHSPYLTLNIYIIYSLCTNVTNQDCKTITTCDNLRRLKTAKIVCTWNSNYGRIVELLGCLMTLRCLISEKLVCGMNLIIMSNF